MKVLRDGLRHLGPYQQEKMKLCESAVEVLGLCMDCDGLYRLAVGGFLVPVD